MAFTVEFDDNGKVKQAINASVNDVKKGLGRAARPSRSVMKSGGLRQHKVKNITSVAILTTENPHIVINQGGTIIVLPH